MKNFLLFRSGSTILVALALAACGGEAVGSSSLGDEADAAPKSGSPSSTNTATGDSQGTVTFRMQAADADAGYSYAYSFGNPGDGIWWYSLATQDGTPVQIALLDGEPYCGKCSDAVPIGFACRTLPSAGVTVTWDGLAANGGTSTCLGGSTNCLTTTYMPAGDYVVTMCSGCPGLADGPGTKCVSVPFHYPDAAEIVGTL